MISLSYLEQLFAQLRRKGLVKSVRGPGGGYLLVRPPEETPIADIMMAVNQPDHKLRPAPAPSPDRPGEGVGSVTAIDTGLKLGCRHPMGPLELADFIGLDVCLAVMQVLYEGLADSKYRPCPLLVKYVEAGWLGRKTGRGFYDYSGDQPVPTR